MWPPCIMPLPAKFTVYPNFADSIYIYKIINNIVGNTNVYVKDSWKFHNFITNIKFTIIIFILFSRIGIKSNLLPIYLNFFNIVKSILDFTFFIQLKNLQTNLWRNHMGSLSPHTIANLVLEKFEKHILTTASLRRRKMKSIIS